MTVDRPAPTSSVLAAALFASALGLAVVPEPAAAADTRAPKIVAATMKDADGDDKADRVVLTYNERIKHRADSDGTYPFKLSAPTYGIRQVKGAKGTKKLVILLKEKGSPDFSNRPDVSYVRGKSWPVFDMAGNEAREQTFSKTKPLPCPANPSSDFYADPVVDRTATPKPTGISSPPWCAYPTLTSALAALQTDGGAGRVIATGAGMGTATFGSETFPLSVPEDVVLTTSLDPELGGPGHDATKYVVPFKGSATHAVSLGGGAVSGFTFKNRRSVNALSMFNCGPGSSIMTTVVLDGAITLGGEIDDGLVLEDGCTLQGGLIVPDNPLMNRVRYFSDTGVVVQDGAILELSWSKIYNNGGDGLWVQGTADLDRGEIAFNGDDGIFVDHSAPSSFHGLLVRDNIDNGVQVDGGDASFTSNKIWNNSRTDGWDSAQVLYQEAPPADGVNSVLYWTGVSCVPVYGFGAGFVDVCTDEGLIEPYPGPSCFENDVDLYVNQVHTYDTSSTPDGVREFTVGLYAADGALVWADNNSWRTGDEAQNVDQDASSFVDADVICPPGGIIFQDSNTSDVPVD